MSTVLVTGAGGYIGVVLVEALLEAGHKVVALDRFFFDIDLLASVSSNPNLSLLRKDVRDVAAENFAGIDAVFDLAALSNDPSGEIDPALTYAINHHGRNRVATMAKQAGVKRYVLASSCSIYGHATDGNLVETSPTNPLSTYAKANLAIEGDVLKLSDAGFCVTILRQATVFGLAPRMRFDLVINLMTLNAVEKGRIFIMGGGKQWRPIVHVRDTARAFVETLSVDTAKIAGEIFNIGLTNAQVLGLAYVVRENLPFPVEMQIVPDDPDRRDYNVSFEKARRVLGYTARLTPADGVREIYDALKQGLTEASPRTRTVEWYKKIVEAKALVDRVALDGRLLD